MPELLVSVRGPTEALVAARGGASIADVEYPASALGTPYPLNILSVREALDEAGHDRVRVSTNIGERQLDRASSCQAALGVATAGADIIKCGLAELPLEAAIYQADSLVRSIKKLYPDKKSILAVFVEPDLQRFFNPFEDGPTLVRESEADGILVDTFSKLTGKGLLNYCGEDEIRTLGESCHEDGREVWIAGSLTIDELPALWGAGVDVICVRAAACQSAGLSRFGEVNEQLVRNLVATIPNRGSS